MRATKKRPLHQRFQIPANAAEEKLVHLGFQVVQKSPTTVILYGPKKANPRKSLTYFSRIALSQHHRNLHLTALYRDNKELKTPWLRKITLLILFISFLITFAFGLDATGRSAQVLAGILLIINIALAAVVTLNPQPPNYARSANLELERLLNQIINQPKTTRRDSFRTIQISSRASLRCAYCHDDLVCQSPYSCPDCKTQIHSECIEELEKCPTLGCQNTQLRDPSPSQKKKAYLLGQYTRSILDRSKRILNSPLF